MEDTKIMNTEQNIVLIGFMGTGKSTVGNKLANRLGLKFVDSDDIIEKRADKSIEEIFAQEGEKYFRDLETEVVSDLGQRTGLVIATGGGVVLRKQNIEALSKNGIIILLTATPEEILNRVEGTDRPLLDVENPLQEIKDLLAQRKEYYDITEHKIDTSNLKVKQVIAKIERIIS